MLIGNIRLSFLNHYDPETKQQVMGSRHSDSPRPKRFRVKKFAGKVLPSILWDQDGILHIDYPLSYGVPVRERYGSTLLPATREQHDQNCTQSH